VICSPTPSEPYCHGLEPVEDKKNDGGGNNCTCHDSQRYYIGLVLPVGMLAGRTTTAKKGMGIHFLAVATRSCDGFEHSVILIYPQLIAIDPRQYHSAGDGYVYRLVKEENTTGALSYSTIYLYASLNPSSVSLNRGRKNITGSDIT